MVSSLYESAYDGLYYSFVKMLSHTGCTDMVSPQYESSYVYQEYSYVKMLSHTGYIYMFFHQNKLSYAGQDPSQIPIVIPHMNHFNVDFFLIFALTKKKKFLRSTWENI